MKLTIAIAMLAAGAMAPAASVWAQAATPLAERTAQSDLPLEGPRAAMRLEHVGLSFVVHPERKAIEGRGNYRVQVNEALSELVFDLDPRFDVDSVRIGGEPVRTGGWENTSGLLTISLPQPVADSETLDVEITWSGTPHEAINPPWEGGFVWSETEAGEPWIATAVQGEGCDLFWPCIDHSSHRIGTLDLLVTVPEGLIAAGNGRLVETTGNGDTTTFNWRARDPSNYGITLQIGPYEVAQRDYESRFGNTIPLSFWHLPGHAEGANRLLGEMADQIAFMEDRFGPYPFGDEKAGVAETPHLGMEHQTINAYGNGFEPEPYGHDWLLQHEFAHEWFANQLRNETVNHMWLAEGITTWTQPLYLEWSRGEMFYDAEMWKLRQRVWSRVPLVPPEGTLPDYNDREAMWGDDIYFKGAWIMHTLRSLVGDEVLFPAITRLTYGSDDPQPGSIAPVNRTTQDFRAILEEMTGRDLGWFFDAYFYQAEVPRLVAARDGSDLLLAWDSPSDLPFAMPVEVRVGDEIVTVAMAGGHGRITLPSADAPYLLDPANRILRHDPAVEAWQNREQAGD
ncbi:M1 family metallopeptidase [Aurantiacibacter poecillastricola]|uniref:M1 family metallopeptidase n=1 Tax=Aurantiacibacter poecillastricola TaxID=3064385 RepID=UPI00273DFB24|nr:M1 family metallopeptidase [Aurantiacibacter sp. 219JJ12-13]MDP5260476.1 M1 family metallopeptidase [Aurantiacibacter sp. 219JJ12-13]